MVNLLKRMVESLNTRKVRRTAARWLAVLVVFATTYSLVLPAITMSTTLKGELDGVEVKVEAGKGVLESGTELVLKNVLLPDDEVVTLSAESGEEQQDEDVIQLTQEELDKILEAAVDGNPDLVGKIIKVLDISLDHRGDEIEPNGLVKLHVSSDLIRDAQQPTLVHLDDEGNATLIATKFNKDEGTLAEEGDEEPAEDEDEDLPSVDSEGYLLDENGERVTDEDGNYTQYEVDEDGSLVLDEDGNPVLVVPTEDEETEDKDGEESEKPADGEESEDKDTEESEKPADGEETKDEESEEPSESQKPEEPTESQKPEESEQPSVSQKPEASEEPTESQKPEASEQPSESQKPADPEPTPETPAAPEQPADPDPEPVPEEPNEPEQPAAPEVTVPDEETALASAPASWGDDDPAATEDKVLVGMTDGFSIYAIVDLVEKTEEPEELPTVDEMGYVIDENGERVTDEDGNYIRYQVDEDGNLVLDEDGNPILVKEITDPTMILLPEGAEIPEGYDKEYTCIAEDKTFAVVVYAPEGALPEGAELVAEVLPDESIETEDGGVVAMDIRFELNGEKVEPTSSVYVVINALGLLPETADPDSVSIQHHKDIDGETDAATAVAVAAEVAGLVDESAIMTADEEPEAPAEEPAPVELPENVEVVADSTEDTGIVETVSTTESATADVTAAFEVEEFSTFTITYQNTKKLTVHIVDEDGNEIGGRTASLKVDDVSGIENSNGVTIQSLVDATPNLSSFEDGTYRYTFKEARRKSATGKKVDKIRYYKEELEYRYGGEDWTDGGNIYFVYTKELTKIPKNFFDDGLAYNNGTDGTGNGLYQSGWNGGSSTSNPAATGSKHVWWEMGGLDQGSLRSYEKAKNDPHVASVTMTPVDRNGSDTGTPQKVVRGDVAYVKGSTYYQPKDATPDWRQYTTWYRRNGVDAYCEKYEQGSPIYENGRSVGVTYNTEMDQTAQLGDIFPDATNNELNNDDPGLAMYVQVDTADQATYLKMGDAYYERGSDGWKNNKDESGVTFYRRYVNTDCYKYARLDITPEPGWYVESVDIACTVNDDRDSNPYDCKRLKSKTAFRAKFDVSAGTASVRVRSDAFSHDREVSSKGYGYYILITTRPIPSPLFVTYDAGKIDGKNAYEELEFTVDNTGAWLAAKEEGNNYRTTEKKSNITNGNIVDKITYSSGNQWSAGDRDYHPTDITEEVKTKATQNGYKFVGWKVVYCNGVTENQDIDSTKFNGESSSVDPNIYQAGGTVTLATHAKLVAQWEKITSAEIVKTVQNVPQEEQGHTKEFTFTVTKDAGNSCTGFSVKTQTITATETKIETKSVTFGNNVAEFKLQMRGNGTFNCAIEGLADGTYTVEETGTGDAKTVTWKDNKQSLEVKNAGPNETQTTATVTVTNDFTPPPTTAKVSFVKTDGTLTVEEGHGLVGAKFELYKVGQDKTETLLYTGESVTDGVVEWKDTSGVSVPSLNLPMDATYHIKETKAPDGYMAMNETVSINFTNGQLVLLPDSIRGVKDENGEIKIVNPTGKGTEEDPYVICIPNNPGTILPSTGGPGLAHFTAFGVALMAAASLVLVLELLKRRGRARA